MLTKTGEIRRDEGCIDYAGQYVMVYPCHGMRGNQEWVYGKVCLTAVSLFSSVISGITIIFTPPPGKRSLPANSLDTIIRVTLGPRYSFGPLCIAGAADG